MASAGSSAGERSRHGPPGTLRPSRASRAPGAPTPGHAARPAAARGAGGGRRGAGGRERRGAVARGAGERAGACVLEGARAPGGGGWARARAGEGERRAFVRAWAPAPGGCQRGRPAGSSPRLPGGGRGGTGEDPSQAPGPSSRRFPSQTRRRERQPRTFNPFVPAPKLRTCPRARFRDPPRLPPAGSRAAKGLARWGREQDRRATRVGAAGTLSRPASSLPTWFRLGKRAALVRDLGKKRGGEGNTRSSVQEQTRSGRTRTRGGAGAAPRAVGSQGQRVRVLAGRERADPAETRPPGSGGGCAVEGCSLSLPLLVFSELSFKGCLSFTSSPLSSVLFPRQYMPFSQIRFSCRKFPAFGELHRGVVLLKVLPFPVSLADGKNRF
ncbi:translation initiation factor IF-2-like [Acinonyx jubatus]|uniref:Translation initiation factor IF-2-like n=1 Tax=Acinonyx jubatus TaxID=32536 RepID=A0ABM3P1V4_ACIJB|nr:translation initiation factor IF-2-like [Acinonyx jubatus]